MSGSITSMLSIELISPRRMLPLAFRSRVSLYFTASALSFSPSWNCTPSRMWMTRCVGILPFVAGRQHRDDVELGIDVEQLVADAGEHDASDIGRAEGRIEQVGILAQADVQNAVLRHGLRGQ